MSNDTHIHTPPPTSMALPRPNTNHDELLLLINSRNPILTVETTEEERFQKLLFTIATELSIPLYTWTLTTGLAKVPGAPIYGTDQPEKALATIGLIQGEGILLLKDFARYCENDRISRSLRDLAEKFHTARRSIVILAPSINLPPELQGEATPFHFGLPNADELLPDVNQVLEEWSGEQHCPVALDITGITQLARNLIGLTEESAMRALRKCLLAHRRADAGLLDAVLDAKRDALRAEGLLEWVPRDASFSDLAGMKHLREWVDQRRNALTPEGRRFGLTPPKGVLITGVQGCGKSLAARAVAGEWGVELARLDAGALYDKYVGESEKRLHKVLQLAQQLAPLVLWIDEIEKGFASAGSSGEADAGLSQRLLATLLTWMQDREGGVFLAATANNIAALPPEMLRKGRFDEIFFVDLPDATVRAALFSLNFKKRGRDAADFDLAALAAASKGFSGAEIEQAIISGLYTAFARKQPLTTEILLGELHNTQPLSVTRAEQVQGICEWAKGRAVPVD